MTNTIPFTEAKAKFSEIIDRVLGGEEILITRHEHAVAKLVPAEKKTLQEMKRVVDAITSSRRRGKKTTVREIVAWKNEGRFEIWPSI